MWHNVGCLEVWMYADWQTSCSTSTKVEKSCFLGVSYQIFWVRYCSFLLFYYLFYRIPQTVTPLHAHSYFVFCYTWISVLSMIDTAPLNIKVEKGEHATNFLHGTHKTSGSKQWKYLDLVLQGILVFPPCWLTSHQMSTTSVQTRLKLSFVVDQHGKYGIPVYRLNLWGASNHL